MNRLVYFLIVGLAVIALQATTVEAQGGDPNMPPPTGAPGAPPMGDATAKPSLGERVKSFFGIGTKDATPPTGAPGAPPTGDISHCAQFSGPPKAACEAAAAGK